MAIVWDQKNISIVVLPDEKLLSSLQPIMQEWIEEGLLGRFLLVGPKSIREDDNDSIVINADLWANGPQGFGFYSVNLFEQIAQYEFEVVRLISLRTLEKGSKISKEQNALLEKIATSVSNALPMANARLNEMQQVTRFLKINLLVSPSKVVEQDYSMAFVKNWDMHVVASPEDRSTPWTADALVRTDERYSRFAMMHLASTAGIWNGLGTSPFELVDRESARDGGIWLSRVFVNAILTDGLSRRVAAKVLDEIATATKDIYDSKIAVQIRGTRPIPPDEVDKWIDWMVGQTFSLEDAFLSFNPPQSQPAPGKLNWLEWEQIKNFLLFSWDKLKVIPWWMYVWARRLVGRKLTQTFQTDQGLAQVGISQNDPMDLRDQRLAYKLASIKEYAETARSAMSTTDAQRSAKGTPRLWSNIRKLLFGMLDGSDLSEFGISESEGRVPVFSNTSQVITDPADAFQIPAEYRQELRIDQITWANIDQVDPLIEINSEKLRAMKARQLEIISRLDQVNKDIDSVETKTRGL
jgi:hypothetical protein